MIQEENKLKNLDPDYLTENKLWDGQCLIKKYPDRYEKVNSVQIEYKKIKQDMFDIHSLDVNSFCDSVLSRSRSKDEKKIDAMLELDSLLYTRMGRDSTLTDKRETKKKSRIIYRSIKSIDRSLGDSFLSHMDKRNDPEASIYHWTENNNPWYVGGSLRLFKHPKLR